MVKLELHKNDFQINVVLERTVVYDETELFEHTVVYDRP